MGDDQAAKSGAVSGVPQRADLPTQELSRGRCATGAAIAGNPWAWGRVRAAEH